MKKKVIVLTCALLIPLALCTLHISPWCYALGSQLSRRAQQPARKIPRIGILHRRNCSFYRRVSARPP